MTHTYTSDVQVLIQFAKDQGWDLPDVVEALREAAVPEGWKLVPVEPTEEMERDGRMYSMFPTATYHAMLAAAPAPENGK